MKLLEETTNDDIENITVFTFAEISKDDCKAWINDSVLYNKLKESAHKYLKYVPCIIFKSVDKL